MKKILIIGAGAMGAAFTVPLIDNNQKVTLTEPYDHNLFKKINNRKKFHPTLKINLSKKLTIKKFNSNLHTIVSEGGVSSTIVGKKFGFLKSSNNVEDILSNSEINTVIIASYSINSRKQVCPQSV